MFNLDLRTHKNPVWNTEFDKELDRFFDVFSKQDFFAPACEIVDNEKFYSVSLDMPGIKEEDIDLEVKENKLAISAERKFVRDEKDTVLRSERHYGSYARVFSLPQDVKPDAIEAKFENGVLSVLLPKEEKAQPRKIAINGNVKKPEIAQ
jgi:HSP20 family protein